MRHFPMFADLSEKLVLVIGQTEECHRKAEMFRSAGAIVRCRAHFSERDAQAAWLIVADVPGRRAEPIAAFGREHKIFVNIVDKPRYCSFIVPAIGGDGDLTIALSSGGRSPALVSWLKSRLPIFLGPVDRSTVEVLGQTRRVVKRHLRRYSERKDFYRKLFEDGALFRLREPSQMGHFIIRKARDFAGQEASDER